MVYNNHTCPQPLGVKWLLTINPRLLCIIYYVPLQVNNARIDITIYCTQQLSSNWGFVVHQYGLQLTCIISAMFTLPSSSGPHSPVTSEYMMEMAQRWYVWMLLHLQLSHSHRLAREGNLHFAQPTLSSLRKEATMSSLILVGTCA